MADRLGITVQRAENAVRQLPSDQLAAAADQARAVQADLSGGGSTVTFSVTTLLLILILVVLIAK